MIPIWRWWSRLQTSSLFSLSVIWEPDTQYKAQWPGSQLPPRYSRKCFHWWRLSPWKRQDAWWGSQYWNANYGISMFHFHWSKWYQTCKCCRISSAILKNSFYSTEMNGPFNLQCLTTLILMSRRWQLWKLAHIALFSEWNAQMFTNEPYDAEYDGSPCHRRRTK